MTLFPTAADDHRHSLVEGEHEAFYFLFSSPDGQVFGFLRTLFGHDAVLELVAVCIGGRTWAHHHRAAISDGPSSPADASGSDLKLTCQEPWQTWQACFHGALQAANGKDLPADLDLAFSAINAPACYSFGAYHQAQQDGRFTGRVQVGEEGWSGELLCYRDHSWGQRPMGAAAGWTIASAPGRFYVVVAEMEGRLVPWGRFTGTDGAFAPVRAPRVIAVEDDWRLEDPEGGMAAWHVARLAPPLVAYLGPAGQEAIRDAPESSDLYRDEIGPARFAASDGRQFVGFLDQARRIS